MCLGRYVQLLPAPSGSLIASCTCGTDATDLMLFLDEELALLQVLENWGRGHVLLMRMCCLHQDEELYATVKSIKVRLRKVGRSLRDMVDPMSF